MKTPTAFDEIPKAALAPDNDGSQEVLEILCRAFDDDPADIMQEWTAWYDPAKWLCWSRALGAFIWHRQATRRDAWRSIETAPKDGTEILIAGGTYYYDATASDQSYPFDGVKVAWWDKGEWNGGYGSEYDAEYWHEPTHWMPVPTRPAMKEAS